MIPKELATFCRYVGLISLYLLLFILGGTLLMLPFMKHFSYETICFIEKFFSWSYPILLGLFAANSKFCSLYCEESIRRQNKAKEQNYINEQLKINAKEQELLEIEMVHLEASSLNRKLKLAFDEGRQEECVMLRDKILEKHSQFERMMKEYDKKWKEEENPS